MNTQRELADRLIRAVSGGKNPQDSKYDPLYVESIIPQLWGRAVRIDYNGDARRQPSRRLNYAWSLNFQPTFNEAIQVEGADYLLFECPRPMLISRFIDGLVYVGERLKTASWTKFTSREDVAAAYARNFFRNGQDIGYFHNGTYLEVYGNKNLRLIDIRIIPSNPNDLSTFDPDTDDFPVDDTIIDIMIELFKVDQNINVNKPADPIFDTAETTSKQQIKVNTQ
jgi:hypothetical protein